MTIINGTEFIKGLIEEYKYKDKIELIDLIGFTVSYMKEYESTTITTPTYPYMPNVPSLGPYEWNPCEWKLTCTTGSDNSKSGCTKLEF